MNHLSKLFNILEITRNQPQYGFALAGGDMRLGNLAEHHYVVAVIAWQLAANVNAKGARINLQKVFEYALIHDLGELFGGDIGMYYAKANPQAREYAKQFEAENQKFLSRFFGDQAEYFSELSTEILNADSDESRMVKVADYLEVTHYKFFMNKFDKADVELVTEKLLKMIDGIKDVVARQELMSFIDGWKKEMHENNSYFHAVIKSLK